MNKCLRHAEHTILVLQSLGYGVNFKKFFLTPATELEHLRLWWDSIDMTVSLPYLRRRWTIL